jgi:hypothetical protein
MQKAFAGSDSSVEVVSQQCCARNIILNDNVHFAGYFNLPYIKENWQSLSKYIFDDYGRPSFSVESEPCMVPLYDALEEGIINNSTGEFAVTVNEFSSPKDSLPVPQVNSIFYSELPDKMFADFTSNMKVASKVFAVPGGDPAWEAVRKKTVLKVSGTSAKLLLHKVFFHELSPVWKVVNHGMQVSSHKKMDSVKVQRSEETFKSCIVYAKVLWKNVTEEYVKKIKSLIVDKAENHKWVPGYYIPVVRKRVNRLGFCLEFFNCGRVTVEVKRQDSARRKEEYKLISKFSLGYN